MQRWLLSTIGRRGYMAEYFKRSAGESCHLVGTGNDAFTPGFAYCDEVALLPAITDPQYPSALLEIVKTHQIDAILTFSDIDVRALASMRSELKAAGVHCFFPGEKTAEIAADKHATTVWAKANDFAAPNSVLTYDDARQLLQGPIVRKPRFGSASVGVEFFDDASLASGTSAETMVFQERIGGVEFNLEVLCTEDSEPIRASVWRKYRSVAGETELSQTLEFPELLRTGVEIAQTLGLVGPNDMDFIVNPAGMFLIEINTRFGGGYPVSEMAGAGFVDALIKCVAGSAPTPDFSYKFDMWMMKHRQPFGGSWEELRRLLKMPADAARPSDEDVSPVL